MFSLIPWRGQPRRSRQLQTRDDFFPTSFFLARTFRKAHSARWGKVEVQGG